MVVQRPVLPSAIASHTPHLAQKHPHPLIPTHSQSTPSKAQVFAWRLITNCHSRSSFKTLLTMLSVRRGPRRRGTTGLHKDALVIAIVSLRASSRARMSSEFSPLPPIPLSPPSPPVHVDCCCACRIDHADATGASGAGPLAAKLGLQIVRLSRCKIISRGQLSKLNNCIPYFMLKSTGHDGW